MVRVTSDWGPLLEEQARAAASADQDAAAEAAANAARLTGEYATTIRPLPQGRQGDVVTGGFGSDHPAAGPLEHGYDAGDRRGPHMRAQPSMGPAGERWGDHLADHLAGTP